MNTRPHYLEIVTSEVTATCEMHAAMHGVSFSDADTRLGGARIAALADGTLLGVRPPLRDDEASVSRIYLRVDDVDAATEAARKSGGEIAVDSMPLGAHGSISIVILDGVEHGLWQPG